MPKWDGEERRKSSMIQEERDLLIRIDANLANLTTVMNTHLISDSKSFDQVNSKIGWLQKITFSGLGALALLKMFLK